MSEDLWRYIEEGDYKRAIEGYTQIIHEEPFRVIHYTNRAIACLGIHDYKAAAQDWREVIRIRGESDSGYMGLGVCQWCLAQLDEAVNTWMQGLDAVYTDAAGGVRVRGLLLYAAIRTNHQALKKETLQLIQRHARRNHTIWPGPIVPYLLGKLSEDNFRVALEQAGQDPILSERFNCQAAFYRGVRGLLEGTNEVFQDQMRRCAKSWYGYLEAEYYLARWEVASNFPPLRLATPSF